MSDYITLVVWAGVGVWFGVTLYRDLRAPLPWQWFQGQVKTRAVVLAVAFGAIWPGMVLLDLLCRVPGARRWVLAFIHWRRPAPES
ncbi:hypothetical protein ACFWY9_37735 [Amycolatopsis sp. NPDC059027]|uniref:hypothetical protein n=1 Tax=Amycolatopsis sp. NPDC059027 TaxID=3346709 RepID=UPI00367124E6